MNLKKHILYFIAAVAVVSMMVVACEKDIVEPTQSTTTDTTPSTPNLPDTPDPQDTVTPAPIVPDFVGLDAWLNGTTWAVQKKEYSRFLSDDYSWRQFRQEYTPQNFTDRYISGTDLDTFYFYADTTYRISGLHTITGAYGLSADSVGTLDGYKRLYQISADSMIVYDWEPDDPLQYIESWLFTKVQ